MTTLTPPKVASFARGAGWTGNDLVTAVAISFAEDISHDTLAQYKPGTGEDSRGLWQINIGGGLWAQRRVQYHLGTPDDLYIPYTSARVAHAIYIDAGRTFRDWSTYIHDTYLKYLSAAHAAVAAEAHTPTLTRYLLERVPTEQGSDVAGWQHTVAARVDGLYGPETKAATQRWQRAHKDANGHQLAADGIVGPLTARAAGWNWAGK